MQFLNRKTLFKVLLLVITIFTNNNAYSTISQWQINRYSTLKYATQLQYNNIPFDESVEYYCDLLKGIIEDTKKLNYDISNNIYSSNEYLIDNRYEIPNKLRHFFRTMAFLITDRLILKFPQNQRQDVRKQIINFHRRYLMEGESSNENLNQLYREFINNIILSKKPN